MKETLRSIFKKDLDTDAEIIEISKLHGDASYRTYYRVRLADGVTYIVMQMPKGKASVSEEITNFNGTHEELPFINVARYLEGRKIPVPRILHYSEKDHIMVLEDLGDDLMLRRVDGADASTQLSWYKKAIDLLICIQQRTYGDDRSECVALQRSFDATLLNWEFDHFLEYGIQARLGRDMEDHDKETFEEETRTISAEIESLPYCFTLRDFQSRNLIIKDDRLHVIDFQDALLGPAAYDLVSLTRDSYVILPGDIVNELINYYANGTAKKTIGIRREYDLITVQRKLKDAGRFVYIDRVKKNPNFLQYIPTSIAYVRSALERLPKHKKLYEVLRKYLPEWT